MKEPLEKDAGLHFDIHASVVLQLGETLITDVAQALQELVKNSYDADATYAKVVINTEGKPGGESYYADATGYISIEDDGIGMDIATIIRGWLTVSNSPKREMKRRGLSTEKGRTPLGDKGLGRLCAQRLASNVEIFTSVQGANAGYHIAFSWDSFLGDSVSLTEVPVFSEEILTEWQHGTKLLISGLRDIESWRSTTNSTGPVEDLRVRLSQLISPYKEVQDFIVSANFNGRKLDFAEYVEEFRRAAILNYKFLFDGDELYIKGKAKLDFFRPARNTSDEEKQEYRYLMKEDSGKKFFEYFMNSNQSETYKIKWSEEEKWYIEYEYTRKLINLDKVKLLNRQVANPGKFSGEIDSFYLDDRSETSPVLGGEIVLKEFLRDIGGLRIYRDGFGIRTDSDLLDLRKQQTSGRSFYGLRPENITGYIALSAKDNAVLEEKTDREGFQATPYYENFYLLLREISKFTMDVQNFLRRSYVSFKKEEKTKNINKEEDLENIYKDISAEIVSLTIRNEEIKKNQEKLREVTQDTEKIIKASTELLPAMSLEEQKASQRITQNLEQVRKDVTSHVESSLRSTVELQRKSSLLNDQVTLFKNQISVLVEQLSQTYETVSLGLTAEALSHELTRITDQLAQRNRQIIDYMTEKNNRDLMITAFTRYIGGTVSSLRKQLSHLEPSLRYVRENREGIVLSQYFEEVEKYYHDRFASFNIEMNVQCRKENDFLVNMNRGKLNQVIDNLILNSEYWLREDLRLKRMARGIISVEVFKPFVRISDNGRGIEPAVEGVLFDPFVTTKGQGRGRGLGLFIVQQLLSSENCTISLLPARNNRSRLYTFEIDFTGGLNGNNR